MKEIFRPLLYKDVYMGDRFLVSNTGKIYSLKSKKILKQSFNKSTGYFAVCVSLGSRNNKKLIKTHIAVASTFIDGYKDGLVVNHKDCNKKNNCSLNLEWVTIQDNVKHAFKNGLIKRKKGCETYNSKISVDDVKKIRQLLEKGERQCDIANMLNVSRNVVYNIAHNKSYTSVL